MLREQFEATSIFANPASRVPFRKLLKFEYAQISAVVRRQVRQQPAIEGGVLYA
jgi:hypothetical protein